MSLKHRIEAWGDLVGRYRRAWSHFWSNRQELVSPDLNAEEAEFLPAALSLQARPVSPTGRWVARLLIALVLALLAWAIVGRTDIIVNAQGKIVPQGQSKTLAAIEVARVHALHVVEGQPVHAGDVLIELDTRLSDSDQQRAEQAHETARLDLARSTALLAALDSGRAPVLPAMAEVDAQRWQAAARHLQDQWRDHSARMTRLDGEIARFSQELPLVTQRARDYAELVQSGDVSRHAWMEKEQARIELEGQLADLRHQKAMLTAELRRMAQEARSEATRQADSALQEAHKARARGELLRITAPIDGTVQQLAAHTVGGVVPAAQPLMQIVPAQAVVEMEAFVENRDIGFVHEGQEAQVKIDAFEYTKYGTVAATIGQVSRDAVQDDKRGPIYAVRLVLRRATLRIDGRDSAITPGMTGSVEIKTGERRIIEYVLSPLVQHSRESLHER